MDRYEGADMRITKCVTIRDFESEISTQPPKKWVNCFDVTSTLKPLCKRSDWQSSDVSHLLLNIDIPNQQPYHLPLLMVPVHCVYLIMFDLRYQVKSLAKIHNVMKNVYTISSYATKVEGGDQLRPRVLLVGMHADEAKSEQKGLFSEKLNAMLKKKPYERLVERDGGEPFWAIKGEDLDLSDTDCDRLLQRIRCYECRGQAEAHQWILRHNDLQEEFKDDPCILYGDLEKNVANKSSGKSMKFDDFLQFLHKYGFIFYHSVEETEEAPKVVLLQPQYLCSLFAKVPELSKSMTSPTIADLLSRFAACIQNCAEFKQWFQRICIDMGLVFEVTRAVSPDFIFLMGLNAGPSSPCHDQYTVPPLVVTFKGAVGEKVEEECLLPSHFFAAFVTEFLKTLTKSYRERIKPNVPVTLPKVASMEQHYVQVCIASNHVHVVEQECCIEIGFQQLEVAGRCRDEAAALRKMHFFCRRIKKAVTDSADSILRRLKLANSSVGYGLYHSRKTEDGTSDNAFAEYTYKEDDDEWILLCSCCDPEEHTPTPPQKIWFQTEEDFPFKKVCLKPIKECISGKTVRKLCDATPNEFEPCKLSIPATILRLPSPYVPDMDTQDAPQPQPQPTPLVTEPLQAQPVNAPLEQTQPAALSRLVYERQDYLMLFRTYVSRMAAGKAGEVLEGVGLRSHTIEACSSAHPLKDEKIVQEGLIRWADGQGTQPPTWKVLTDAMDYAGIAGKHVRDLKEKLEATQTPLSKTPSATPETVTGAESFADGSSYQTQGPKPSPKPSGVPQGLPRLPDGGNGACSGPVEEMVALPAPSQTVTGAPQPEPLSPSSDQVSEPVQTQAVKAPHEQPQRTPVSQSVTGPPQPGPRPPHSSRHCKCCTCRCPCRCL